MRKYQSENDYWRIRAFLRRVFLENDGREFSWQAYRFDYWRWHGVANLAQGKLENDVYLWETENSDIAAVLHCESPGSVFLQMDPKLVSPEIEIEMISVAEIHLSVIALDGQRKVGIWAGELDERRQAALANRSFVKTAAADWQRCRLMSEPIPDRPIPEGFTVRAIRGEMEFPARSWLSWRAFHPDDTNDKYEGWEWYRNIQRAPLYRRELDLVAVAPDGELAAFGTVWFDDVTRAAAFEPMGTSPEYQQRGLASVVMIEGLRRLRLKGAETAFVGSWNDATHRLYGSMGFTRIDKIEKWVKVVSKHE